MQNPVGLGANRTAFPPAPIIRAVIRPDPNTRSGADRGLASSVPHYRPDCLKNPRARLRFASRPRPRPQPPHLHRTRTRLPTRPWRSCPKRGNAQANHEHSGVQTRLRASASRSRQSRQQHCLRLQPKDHGCGLPASRRREQVGHAKRATLALSDSGHARRLEGSSPEKQSTINCFISPALPRAHGRGGGGTRAQSSRAEPRHTR